MPLNIDARTLLGLADQAAIPPIETLDPVTARSFYDTRSADAEAPDVFSVEDRTIPGPGGDIAIRIYHPTESAASSGAVAFFHGGGWVIGTIETHDAAARALAIASDHIVVSVDYRLAPEHRHPAAVEDAFAATTWIIDNAAELAVDAARVAVCGDSAGGNLAAIVAQMCTAAGQSLLAQLLVYPATDLTEHDTESSIEYADSHLLTVAGMHWFIDHYVPDVARRAEPRCSPAFGVFEGLPPTFILLAECDPLRSDGELYAAALRKAGVATELVQIDGEVHSFFTQIGVIADAQRAADELARFLRSLS